MLEMMTLKHWNMNGLRNIPIRMKSQWKEIHLIRLVSRVWFTLGLLGLEMQIQLILDVEMMHHNDILMSKAKQPREWGFVIVLKDWGSKESASKTSEAMVIKEKAKEMNSEGIEPSYDRLERFTPLLCSVCYVMSPINWW
jgi:hypothetical protein